MTNSESLLNAALLAGMPPDGSSVHRYQLYYLVQGSLGRRIGTNDLQRALETATDSGDFINEGGKGSGRYGLTQNGYRAARKLFPNVTPEQAPAAVGDCRLSLTSPQLQGNRVNITCVDGKFNLKLNDRSIAGVDLLRWLNNQFGSAIPERADSAPRRVYDYGIIHGWDLQWNGPMIDRTLGELPPTEAQIIEFLDEARRRERFVIDRPGQGIFRDTLLEVYGARCVVTHTAVRDALEAAHIFPYHAGSSNQIYNGLLLRADIHKLFDRDLIQIAPQTRRVKIASILSGSEYACLDGKVLRDPMNIADRPRDGMFKLRRLVYDRLHQERAEKFLRQPIPPSASERGRAFLGNGHEAAKQVQAWSKSRDPRRS